MSYKINYKAVAVAGIGFGVIAIATAGLLTPDTAKAWDTSQGKAGHSSIAFKPWKEPVKAPATEQVVPAFDIEQDDEEVITVVLQCIGALYG
jgi:hypothetical protein